MHSLNPKFLSNAYLNRLIRSLVASLVLASVAVLSVAQNIQNPQSAVDNLMRSNLRVDPSTGAMQIQIPLGGPPGRGEANLPVVLNYSSKVWNIKHLNTMTCDGEPVSHYYADYAKSSASGWTSTVGWMLPNQDASLETYGGMGGQPATQGNPTLWRVMRKYVTLPDGSRHELRRDDSLHSSGASQDGVYYSVDGSRLVYDTATDTLFLPNGLRILNYFYGRVLGNPSTQYVDRHGNFVTYDTASATWTDTLNRSIGIPIGPEAGTGDVTYTLPGGLTYTLRWKSLADARTDPSQELRYKGDAPFSSCSPGGPQPGTLFSTQDALRKILQHGIFNPSVLWRIELSNGTNYTFTYNVYGELDKIAYPTGGNEQFTYGTWEPLGGQLDDGTISQANRGVLTRSVSDGVNPAQNWSYFGNVFETGVDPATAPKSFTAPDGTVTKTWYYKSRGASDPNGIKYGFDDARTGMEREVRVFNSAGVMLRRTVHQLAYDGPQSGGYSTATRNARVTKTVEIILDTGGDALAAATEMTYDADLNVIATKRYDFVSISQATAQTADIPSIPNGTLLRTEETDHLTHDANYRARNMLSLPTATRVKDGAGNIVAQSSISYDESAYPLLTYGAVTGWADPGTNVRGLPTTIKGWLNTTGAWLETHSQYDQCGSLRNSWDAKGNQSQVEYSSTYAYAYPTLTRTPVPDPTGQHGSATAFVATNAFNLNTGLVTSTTDANNITTTFEYDSLNRPTRTVRASGSAVQNQTTITFDETNRLITTTSDQDSFNDPSPLKSQILYDGLGRTKESRQYETASTYITVQTEYDVMGRAYKTSNPFRSGETVVWTTSQFDALGRMASITTPDNAVVATAYSGDRVLVTDHAGKQRMSKTNALGQLKDVWEVRSSDSATEAISFPGHSEVTAGYRTSYDYDTLDSLIKVSQGSQSRYFMYDSLKRLIRARNPEQGTNAGLSLSDPLTGNAEWSIGYNYDNNGNLTSKTDARSITASYTYDALNRVLSRSYSDGTPAVTYIYDPNIANGKGRLSSVSSSVSIYSYGGYDALGRAGSGTQTIGSQSYTTTYTYGLAGQVKTMIYPSGHLVTYNYDDAGRLADKDAQNLAFTGNLGDGTTPRSYATSISYSSLGGMQEEKFGTTTPIYHKQRYNVRGQLYDVRVSTLSLGQNEFDWNRGAVVLYYGGAAWGQSGTANNGNVTMQQHFVPLNESTSNYAYTQQSYLYDSLNRLSSVSELHGTQASQSGNDYVQAYSYDRYGNRTIDAGATWGTGINNKQFTVSTSNNRLGVPGGQSGTMTYDSAGNLTTDTYSGTAVTRVYDAENKMTSETTYNSVVAGSYSYDGDGHRVRRVVAGGIEETWQVYGIGGELLAEYAQNGAAANPQKEHGYRNGELLITATVTTGWGSAPTLADNPLQAGVTAVKAQHISELRDAINSLRSHMSMSPYSWQYSATTSDYISANPILEMRTALDQALGAPGGGYAAGLAQGQPIKAIHIQELRDRVLAAWVSGGSIDIRWLVTDHLGTPRMVFDQTGSLASVSRHDYLPFGEELYAGAGGRTTTMGYTSGDTVRQKFTLKERDNETGLDYFLARYYSSSQGRFTSPDEFWKDSQVGDPQSWNKYAYVRNNPLRYIDPEGEKATVTIETDEERKKGKITVKASIALWTNKGFSKEEMQKAAQEYKANIEKAWSGTYEQDGIKYEVTTTVDIQVYGGEQEATNSGAQNVLRVVEEGGHSYMKERSVYDVASGQDRGQLAIDAGRRNSEAAHEFTHLLGVDNRYSGKYLSNTYGAQRAMTATAWDYAWAFGGEIKSHRDASRPNRPVPFGILNRAPAGNGRGAPRNYRSTREVGAAFWLWR